MRSSLVIAAAPASETSAFVNLTISSIVWVAEAATGLSGRSVITVVIIIRNELNFTNCHLLLLTFLNFGSEVVFSVVVISTDDSLFCRLGLSNNSLIEATAAAEVLKHVALLTVVSDRTWCPL